MLPPVKRQLPASDGLFGFNGTLVAIALMLFLQSGALTWVDLVAAAAASSTVLMAIMLSLLQA